MCEPAGAGRSAHVANEPMEPTIIARPDHCISRNDIDPDVLRILYRLKRNDFEAYLVGGAIRDMLRGQHPKDFDVATNATPSELRGLFRNSRIIGRRFRLVHVFYADKNIEVATLRSAAGPSESEGLYVEDDNEWGDVESDALRRDFTINQIYYDIRDFSLIDHAGGIADIEQGLIRSLGDPMVRMQEDPVRMLRAIKFAARFGYTIDPDTDHAISVLPDEIIKASRFRVTEEIFRILTQAHRDRGLELLHDYGFLRILYPTWIEAIGEDGYEQVHDFFALVEREAREGRYLPLEVIAAGLFLPLLGTVDPQREYFNDRYAALAAEVRQLGDEMDLPKRLMAAVVALLRGQLYMLFFAHRRNSVKRFVHRQEFDYVWRLNDLAFGHLKPLHSLQEVWLHARESIGHAIGGWVDSPDRRDVFSFRGQRGGGRRKDGDAASVVIDDRPAAGPRRRRRRRC